MDNINLDSSQPQQEGSQILFGYNLVKSYRLPHKKVDVLNKAFIHANAGELVAVIGQSGSGKSTLLHLLGGIDRPDSGEVTICGESFYSISPSRRAKLRATEIGFVFQAFHLLSEMTVLENVMLPAMAAGELSRTEMKQRAGELLVAVGLSDRLTHTPIELSGGEQQRAAIARALMNKPQLILADEPTGNLDRDTGTQILDLLFNLVRAENRAMIIVTHDPVVAARCDRRLLLSDGKLLSAD